jgi:hypothetical protein
MFKLLLAIILITISGCSTLTPEIINALANDPASFCALMDTRGGVGAVLTPAGGYGQATMTFCRSAMPNAKISLHTDGTISIEHGGPQ